ncbi:MAG: HDOD domain-containing protein [Nitrospirae bacterium]|nr:HDOD domain-containing protein [Nitrospirota bacterium]
MKHLLFVDDEPRLLDGLRRTLRPMREECNMAFVESGEAALQELAKGPVDVVVTDMRMPGMDGAQLLAEVRKLYPAVVRIVLTGQSGKASTLRSVGQAHQCLAKPCEADELKHLIMRALALREMLSSESVRVLVGRIDALPSLPIVYTDLVSEIESPTSSMESVAKIIARDMAMTTKVLQLVNSAFFGLSRTVSHPAQAIGLLGLDTVKSLVLGVQVFSAFRGARGALGMIEQLWKHSVATGHLARAIAQSERVPLHLIEIAFTAGLLHDVGVLVLAANLGEPYQKLLQAAGSSGTPLSVMEREQLGATHAEVGAYLLGLWGLGDGIVEAVAFHHAPTQCLNRAFGPLTAVHVASGFDQESPAGSGPERPSVVDGDYLASLGMADRLPHWRELAHSSLQTEAVHD